MHSALCALSCLAVTCSARPVHTQDSSQALQALLLAHNPIATSRSGARTPSTISMAQKYDPDWKKTMNPSANYVSTPYNGGVTKWNTDIHKKINGGAFGWLFMFQGSGYKSPSEEKKVIEKGEAYAPWNLPDKSESMSR
mmetsp:Transcript_65425/g.103625  ORF Transcript_65425/g.103625 Transcript_65425/m.103625 type:complete len:139 (-) Transcript_65425:177-593(-)